MRIKATVSDSAISGNKIIQFEVCQSDIYKVMRMLYRGGFEVDYKKVG